MKTPILSIQVTFLNFLNFCKHGAAPVPHFALEFTIKVTPMLVSSLAHHLGLRQHLNKVGPVRPSPLFRLCLTLSEASAVGHLIPLSRLIATGSPGGAHHPQVRQISCSAPQVSYGFNISPMMPALPYLVLAPSYALLPVAGPLAQFLWPRPRLCLR